MHHWKNGQRTEYRLKWRAAIIWELAHENKTPAQVAKDLHTTVKTVKKWSNCFEDQRIAGLYDLPRSGAPAKFNVQQRCEVIAIACDRPINYGFHTHPYWTLHILTEAAAHHTQGPKMSRSSIQRTIKHNDLHPQNDEMWLYSKDPNFREKVNDIVSLYLHPPKNAVVICMDEKTGMQALERKVDPQPALPGRRGRFEHEYIRHGTQSLIAGFEITTGDVVAQVRSTRKADDLLAFMEKLAKVYPDQQIIIVWDNLIIHKDSPSGRWRKFNEPHNNRFSFHYTPIHASWVNQVELFFSILHKRCLKWSSFRSEKELKEAVMAFIQHWNEEEGHPFNWTFGGYSMQNEPKEAA
ncbi:IS630 family transposase [Virgibacillus sp. 179-BFC.A HS]|uniref:IS630 family transposase n=1 Tax=Tigheibacillus jepli TaxID=3035914 RepID=A0ABU5CEE5_9BACI|nr:IS630 family transposase [Virgibacillus sp. 179-BFC.A HS]MDY0404704.1 IS630 family transposase [Virgibacillus sp. 179-BFC.A HS]